MPGISSRDLRTLVEHTDGPAVSLYMPTERAGADTKQNSIRLKNLLNEASTSLTDAGLRSADAEALLEPAASLVDQSLFWQRQSDGLALFVAPDTFLGFRQPLRFEELVTVGPRFHVKPLLPLLSGDGKFYVVALSQQEVRILEGSHYAVDELSIEDVPASLAEALKYDEFESQQQWHTATAPQFAGRRPAIFHGHGVGHDDENDAILRYFRQVDQGLNELLADGNAPLVVAGVEFLHPIYAAANTYPHLLENGVRGNPEPLSAEEIHGQAWDIVRPRFEAAQREASDRFHAQLGTGLASASLDVILPAAADGRVDTLFVALDRQAWGRFDPATRSAERVDEPGPDTVDLLDLAAVHTMSNGGTVYAEPRHKLPDGDSVAAVFRY